MNRTGPHGTPAGSITCWISFAAWTSCSGVRSGLFLEYRPDLLLTTQAFSFLSKRISPLIRPGMPPSAATWP